MASALPFASSLPLLLSLLLCFFFYSSHVHGQDQELDFGVVRVDTMMPASVCSASSKALGRNSLKITHRRGPCSPFAGGKPSHQKILHEDLLRVDSLQKRLSSKSSQGGGEGGRGGQQLQASSEVTFPARRGTTFASGNYIVTVGFGSPRKDQTVIFDTGSNVCWIQCKPCAVSCYQQQEPIFDPSASSSYHNVSCNSATCGNLDVKGCSGGTCLYLVRYGDNSSTLGFLATDTLTLSPPAGGGNVFPGFVFGCGQRNQGLFGKVAGLLGLGRSPFSLVSQTSQTLGDVFSYCLPASSSSTGHLTIGRSTSPSATYTPMVTDVRDGTLYFLDMTGISVGGNLLPVSAAVFQTAGTLIDSGTVITRLPPAAYDSLRSAFRAAMSQYTRAPALSLLDTCYDLSKEQTITYPIIVLHFAGGTDVKLDATGIFFVASISQVCLGFAGNANAGDVGIFGNVQQRTMEVIHDIGAQKIGFAPGACS